MNVRHINSIEDVKEIDQTNDSVLFDLMKH